MLTLRLILVYALVAQLGAAYRCCPVDAQCSVPADASSCCSTSTCCGSAVVTTTCCSTHDSSHDEQRDERQDGQPNDSDCPCCKQHRLGSKKPMESVPAPEHPTLALLAVPGLAPVFEQPDVLDFVIYWEARPLRARPMIERLAQLSVWRT